MFFDEIPKPCNIKLSCADGDLNTFYNLSVKEESFINGTLNIKKHINSLIHTNLTAYNGNLMKMHIERFDTVIRDRSLSLGEKDLYEVAERIFDDVQLIIDETGKVKDVLNFAEICTEGWQNKEYLKERYKGDGMKTIDRFYDTALNHKSGFLNYLCNYSRMGLLLYIPYGFLSASFLKSDIVVRHNNLMLNTCADVTEYFKLEEVNPKDNFIVIKGKGDPAFADKTPIFRYEMQRLKIESEKHEKPELNEYTKQIKLNLHTGVVLSSSLNILFSFGKNYYKKIEYELKKTDAQTL